MSRPNLEGLFTGSAPTEPPMTWLNGKPTGLEPPSTPPVAPAAAQEPEPAGLFDPVAIAERYFALMQSLLDVQREFGMRLARQIAAALPTDRLRR